MKPYQESVVAEAERLGATYDGRGNWDFATFPTAEARDAMIAWLEARPYPDGRHRWQKEAGLTLRVR